MTHTYFLFPKMLLALNNNNNNNNNNNDDDHYDDCDSSGGGGSGGGGGGAGEGRDYHVKAQQFLLMREATPAKTRTIGHNEHDSHQKVIAVTIACN